MIALLATWAAGFVDTVGFLLLSDILTANMSGNTVRIGIGAVTMNGAEALRRGWPVAMFVAGLFASALIHEAGWRRRFLSTSAVTFGIEAVFLLCFEGLYIFDGSGLGHGATYLAATAFLAFAMGLQNATVTRVGALSVKTTHVTGTLTKFAEGASQFFFWARDRLRATGARRWHRTLLLARRQKSFREAVLMLLLWVGFIVGSICGAATKSWAPRLLLIPPAAMAIVLAMVDVARPIAASDEHKVTRHWAA